METKSTSIKIRSQRLEKVTKVVEYNKKETMIDILDSVARMEGMGYHIDKIEQLTEKDNLVIHFNKYMI